MSAINGDKSRHSINRKRVLANRAKIRKLVGEAKSQATATGDQAATTPRPSTAKQSR